MWEVRFSSQLRYRISGWLHGPVQRHRGEPGHTVRCKEGSMDTQNSHLPPIVYSRCLDNFHIWKSDHAYYRTPRACDDGVRAGEGRLH